jgi:hypothetical protein
MSTGPQCKDQDSTGPGPALPCPEPVAAACRTATAHNLGDTIAAGPVVTAAGIRVVMVSWPRQQEALRALRALGYQAAEDQLKDGEAGAALLLTGWDTALLAERAARLENAVSAFERDMPSWADEAITRFTDLQDADGQDDAVVQEQVIAETRRSARNLPGPPHLHLSAPVDARDRDRATGEVRVLLDRVAAGGQAVTRLTEAAGKLAETAIGLFLEYRGLASDDEAAAAKAFREIAEYAGSIHDCAVDELLHAASTGAWPGSRPARE